MVLGEKGKGIDDAKSRRKQLSADMTDMRQVHVGYPLSSIYN